MTLDPELCLKIAKACGFFHPTVDKLLPGEIKLCNEVAKHVAATLQATPTPDAEQAVKDAVLRIDGELSWLSVNGHVRSMLRRDFPSAFTPTPPKEQQPVNDLHARACREALEEAERVSPSPDPATVRLCIERLKAEGYDDEAATRCLESLLPKPNPAPEPVYVELDTSGYSTSPVAKLTVAEIAARHGLLTPETALVVSRQYFNSQPLIEGRDDLLDDLRCAAKGESK